MQISIFGRDFYINKALAFAAAIVLTVGSGVLGYFLNQVYKPLSEPIVVQNSINDSSENTGQPAEANPKAIAPTETIKVYVVGCVKNSGVYELDKGAVIDDAIKLAGGSTKEADLENINLAFQLKENTMLRIKSKNVSPSKTSGSTGAAGTSTNTATNKPSTKKDTVKGKQIHTQNTTPKPEAQSKMNSGVDIITDSLATVVAEEGSAPGGSEKSKLVNINTATQAELEGLPNVGPATAKAIIDYREKNGLFKKLTDLMKITGIKQKTYDKIKEYICV